MLENLIGKEAFLSGTSAYLKAHPLRNTTSADLWASVRKASGVDVGGLMAIWTNKVGFPVVTVHETVDGLQLRQNRFLSSGDPTPEEDSTLWPIPLAIKLLGHETQNVLMSTRDLVVPLAPGSVYTVNSETAGAFRVSYAPAHLARLAEEASKVDSKLSLADRLGIFQDAIVLAEAGHTRTSSTLGFMKQMTSESEYLVWAEIALSLRHILLTWCEEPTEVQDPRRHPRLRGVPLRPVGP